MKTLFKTLIVAFAVMGIAFSSVAYAASTNSDSSIDTLYVTDKGLSNNAWAKTTTVSDGEALHVMLHYYLDSDVSAQNMRFAVDNLAGKTFNQGQTITVGGKVMADNLSTSNGSAQVTFADNVRLDLYNVSWQKDLCSSVGCEESLVDNAGKVLTNSGMSIGNVDGYTGNNWQGTHYTGNVVVSFKVSPVNTPTPTYDDCRLDGVTVAHGDSRTFYAERTVPSGNTCSMYAQTRSCSDGVLSGSSSYRYASCRINDVVKSANVSTLDATNITEDSARLNGYVDFMGYSSADVYFVWGTSSNNLNNTTSQVRVSNKANFNRVITNLNDDTRYYYQAIVETTGGEFLSDGIVRSFTTDREDDPVNNDADVRTLSATNVDEDSARLRGDVDFDGYSSVDVYFEWGTSRSNLNNDTREQRVTSDRSFSQTIDDLDDDRTYYYRAVVETTGGSVLDRGSIEEFETDRDGGNSNVNDDEPRAETESPRNIRSNSAVLRGNVDMNDFRDGVVFFVYGESESDVDDVENEDSYANVDTDGDDLRKVLVDSDLNSDRDYERTVSGLDSNTRHYYRICVEFEDDDNDEMLECGSIDDFRTDNGGGSVIDPNPSTDAATITRLATNITTTSANLRSFVTGEGSATCFFQYGRSTAFGSTTPTRTVNLDNTTSCESTRFNLRSNTTYFYRSVLVDSGKTYYGLTQSFRTNSVPVIVNPSPRPPVNNGDIIVNVIEQVEREDINEIELTKFISALDDARFSDRTEADRDETVFHKVVLENNGNDVLRDIVVTDYIPFELELDERRSLDDDTRKQVSWRVARLDPGETREFTTELRVRDSVRYGEFIDSNAQASNDDFTVTSNDVYLEIDEREIFEDNDANQSASIFGSGFFPDSLLGWLLLIVIALVIAYIISRLLFARNENERVLAELRAMQNNNS